MGILDPFGTFFRLGGSLRDIIFSVIGSYIGSCRLVGFLGDTGGIGTKVGNQTHGTAALDIDSFIELLSDPHGLLGGKIQNFGCFLLQRTGREGKGRFLDALAFFHIADLVLGIFQLLQNFVDLLLAVEQEFLFVCSIKFCLQRLFLPGDIKICVQGPVLLRNKGVDLLLPVRNNAKGHRLHTSGA